jgi:hypothetical protein
MKRLILTFAVICLLAPFSHAVDLTVTGKVTSIDDGSALSGVNVALKGTIIGTITDYQGMYTITIPDSRGKLVFSFIGYASEEIAL